MPRRFQFSLRALLGVTTFASVVAALLAMGYVLAAFAAMSGMAGIAGGRSFASVGCGVASAIATFSLLAVGSVIVAVHRGAPGP